MRDDYRAFIASKQFQDVASGFEPAMPLNESLFDHQAAIVRWALRRGRAAVFANTGLGKTVTQLEWARHVAEHTSGKVLVVAPLAVATQTVEEAGRFGIDAIYSRKQANTDCSIVVTNYEMLDHFDISMFAGIVLDESSILKSADSKTRNRLIDRCRQIPYRLSCTATPSPNDHMELGNQAEFLGVMSMQEMLAMFFTHDGGDTSKWRLKGHGAKKFWEWLATWAVTITSPADLGFDASGYDLPPLNMHEHLVSSDGVDGDLFVSIAQSLTERRAAKKETITQRVEQVAELCNGNSEQWLVWCHTNDESAALTKAIDGAVEVKGSDSINHKEQTMDGFRHGRVRVMVSKLSICGFGLNLQNCHQMAFVGLDDSYEQMYQAVRRCWRFGQTKPVDVHIVTAEALGAIKANIERKEQQMADMQTAMVEHMKAMMQREINGAYMERLAYQPEQAITIPDWIRSNAA